MGEPDRSLEVIGRAQELEAVARLLDGAQRGLASLVIDGDAGIGKTSLWRAAIDRATATHVRVLRAAPAESERLLTLGGLTDLLADVVADDLAALPAVQAHALEIALLRTEPSGRLPDQRTLSVATATLLRHLASNRELLIAADDAQWLDDASSSVLGYAVRRLADQPVRLLLAVRGTPGPRIGDIVAGVPEQRRAAVHVGPMPLAALHQLFLARLGRSFPRLVLVRIEAASAGNPFYAIEVARALIESGSGLAPADPLPIPQSLAALVETRVAALPPTTRGALLLAAVAAEPTIEALRRADPGVPAALEAAAAAGVATIHRDVVRFSHPLLAQAVVATAGRDDLRRAHATLARTAVSDEARARHLAGATDGRDAGVAAALDDAAASARDRGATLDASALYQRASDLTPETLPDLATRRAVLAAECLFIDVSEMVQADAILEAAIGNAAAGPARADALSLRALIRYYHGQTPEAIRLGEQAMAEAGADPITRARILGRTSFLVMQLDLVRGTAIVTEALNLLDGIEPGQSVDPDLRANLMLLHATAELGLVREIRSGEIEAGTALITQHGRTWEHDGADGIAYGLARILDQVDRAIAMTERLIQAKSGPSGDDPFNLVSLSGLQAFRGDLDVAEAAARAGIEGYAREGADLFPAWRLRGLALVSAYRGRLDEARDLSTEGLALASASGDLALEVYHRHILGFVALSRDDAAEADEQLSLAALAAERSGTRHPGRFKIDGDRVVAAIAVGDLDRAEGIVAFLEHAAAVAPTPWTRAIALRSRGQVRAARGDFDGAIDALEAALAAHDDLPMPLERALTLLATGQVHRRRKAKHLAAERLGEALGLLDRVGSTAWADRVRAEIRRVGLRPHAPEDLTETERRVAELAAAGLSSRQIGERAFLAPKTVGNVLGRVYAKLGIHSRAQLGARISAVIGEGAAGDPAADRSG